MIIRSAPDSDPVLTNVANAPFRADRGGHHREHDRFERHLPQQLTDHETACLKMIDVPCDPAIILLVAVLSTSQP